MNVRFGGLEMEREKRILWPRMIMEKKTVCRRAAGFIAAVMLAAADSRLWRMRLKSFRRMTRSASEQWAFFNDGSFTSEEDYEVSGFTRIRLGQPSENAELLGTLVEVKKRAGSFRRGYQPETGLGDIWNGSHDTIVAMIDTGIDASMKI